MRTLYLFLDDLRCDDNPGLASALAEGPVLPLYIRDLEADDRPHGAAAWYLHQALQALGDNLRRRDLTLHLRQGDTLATLRELIVDNHIDALFCARGYNPTARSRQQAIAALCKELGIAFRRFAGTLLYEPDSIENKSGEYFKVFTPFYKHCRQHSVRNPCTLPKEHAGVIRPKTAGLKLRDFNLLPHQPNWAKAFRDYWFTGERAVHTHLHSLMRDVVPAYAQQRDQLAASGTSFLSPLLRFGVLSPAQVWHEVSAQCAPDDAEPFLRQLVWREFQYHLLYHRQDLLTANFKSNFDAFPWREDKHALRRWQQGQTGYPVVDAAMRQLWHSGWMHNRARMIVASFLCKHLLLHWKHGADWFMDTLVDADLANNTLGWQWTAGSGADAAPYFRIFNPVTQAERFDPQGEYIHRWVPELRQLKPPHLFAPWDAPAEALSNAGIQLGEHYPHPLVDHRAARQRALDAYDDIKGASPQ